MGSFLFLELLSVVFLLSIFTTIFNKKFLGLPPAIGVPIVSALAVFLLQWVANLFNGSQYISINITEITSAVKNIHFYDFLINGVICFVLMASSLKFKISDLKTHWKPISILATLSLVLCAGIFGGVMFGFQYLINSPIPLVVLFLLASALSATDPIGIKGVLSNVKAPNHLMVKLEGESLFNDAMCIALFMTLYNIVKGGDFTVISVIQSLLFEVTIAAIIGYVAGRFALVLLKGVEDLSLLIMITALLACGSYLIALYAHASAPITCVVAGFIVGNKWQELINQNNIDEVNHFWHTIEEVINSFLFTLIGLELFILDLDATLVLCGIFAFFVLHISRFVSNNLSFALFPNLRKNSMNGSLTILSWAGVRGGISLALILAVLNTPMLQPYSSFLLGYTFISVLLSGVVCGLGLPSVINAFYYNPNEPTEGFQGWYQKMCHKMNRKGFKYEVIDNPNGTQTIRVYSPNETVPAKAEQEGSF